MMSMELTGTNETNAAALRKQCAARAERNRRLESIKMQRRLARRGKWLQGIKSLANVLSQQSAEAVN